MKTLLFLLFSLMTAGIANAQVGVISTDPDMTVREGNHDNYPENPNSCPNYVHQNQQSSFTFADDSPKISLMSGADAIPGGGTAKPAASPTDGSGTTEH